MVFVFPFFFACSSTRLQPKIVDSLPALPQSVVNLPIKIYAKPLLDKAETLAPLEFTSEQWPGYTQQGCDFRYKYRFMRSMLRFTCINNRVSISLTGNYQVAGSRSACLLGKQIAPWISGSCGFDNEPLRRVNITLASTLRFLPNYTLRSKSVVEKIDPVDKCAVSFLNTDITGMIMNTVRNAMNQFTGSLDRDIARLNIFPLIRSIETGIGKKIMAGKYGYLSVQPYSIKTGKINYTADTLYLTAGVSLRLELSADSANYPSPKTSLPPLAVADVGSGFALYANAGYDYPFLSPLLAQALQHRLFAIRKEKISIDSIEIKGSGNGSVEVKALFSGSKKGVLYLTGTPALDTAKQLISVPDLRFSLRSRSFVLNAGKSFFSKKILRALRKQAVVDINKLYRQNKTQIDQALTHQFSKQVSSTGTTGQLALRGMILKKDKILLQLSLKGNATLLAVPAQE